MKIDANLDADFQQIKNGPSRHTYSRLNDLARSIPLETAPAALERARARLSSSEFMMFSEQVFSRWAEADPAALVAYAEFLEPLAAGRDSALSAGLAEWAYVSPVEATQYVEALPRKARGNLFETILPGIASSDPDRALTLVTNLSVSQRFQAKSQILSAIAETDPAAAFEFFKRHQNDPVFGRDERLLEGPLQTWIGKDPNAAAAWLAAQPEAFQKRHADEAARALQSLAQSDPVTAAALVVKLPNSTDNKCGIL